MPELVQAREDTAQVVPVEARGQADVRLRHVRGERVDGVVEPPRLVVHPPARQHLERELSLSLRREVAVQARVAHRLADFADERYELVLQAGEDRSDVCRPHAPLVIVEEDVVRVVERLVTGNVLARELEPPLEVRAEDLVVRGRARLEPGAVAERAGSGHLGAQLARHAALLLVVSARDADDARLERLRLRALLERPQLVEQRAELRRRGAIVREPGQGRELLGPGGRAERRHPCLLVPGEEVAGALEVGDLAEAPQELVEAGVEVRHDVGAYRRGEELPGLDSNQQPSG